MTDARRHPITRACWYASFLAALLGGLFGAFSYLFAGSTSPLPELAVSGLVVLASYTLARSIEAILQ